MKRKKGMTMLALIITIFILLMITIIVITLAMGENGILEKTKKVVSIYEEAKTNEIVQMNTVEEQIENNMSEIPEPEAYHSSLRNLKEGDYIWYLSKENEKILCRVLYTANETYGLQIVSQNIVKEVTLGGSNWEEAKTSYNNAISILNEEAMQFLNPKYASDVRTIGSNPSNKTEEREDTIHLSIARPKGWTSSDTGCKNTDVNYKTDREKMKTLKILGADKEYWYGSREIKASSSVYYFNIRTESGANQVGNRYLALIRNVSGGENVIPSYYFTSGLRICITLRKNAKIIKGDGLTKDTAYEME